MNSQSTVRPSPALFAGFLAIAAALVIAANLPLVSVAMQVIG